MSSFVPPILNNADGKKTVPSGWLYKHGTTEHTWQLIRFERVLLVCSLASSSFEVSKQWFWHQITNEMDANSACGETIQRCTKCRPIMVTYTST